jgi:hypothetical protein
MITDKESPFRISEILSKEVVCLYTKRTAFASLRFTSKELNLAVQIDIISPLLLLITAKMIENEVLIATSKLSLKNGSFPNIFYRATFSQAIS